MEKTAEVAASEVKRTPVSGPGKKKAKKDTAQAADILYALAPGEAGENGIPKLTKKFSTEGEAILEAFKLGVPYYRIQKCVVQPEQAKGGMRLIGVPAS
jgi:hypothetical protein